MIPSRWKVTLLFLQNENHEDKRNIKTKSFIKSLEKVTPLVTDPLRANSDPLQSQLGVRSARFRTVLDNHRVKKTRWGRTG